MRDTAAAVSPAQAESWFLIGVFGPPLEGVTLTVGRKAMTTHDVAQASISNGNAATGFSLLNDVYDSKFTVGWVQGMAEKSIPWDLVEPIAPGSILDFPSNSFSICLYNNQVCSAIYHIAVECPGDDMISMAGIDAKAYRGGTSFIPKGIDVTVL
jgi:hypothetical protein